MLITGLIWPIVTMHSHTCVQTERAYCVPTGWLGNVLCLHTLEELNWEEQLTDLKLRIIQTAKFSDWLIILKLMILIQGKHNHEHACKKLGLFKEV